MKTIATAPRAARRGTGEEERGSALLIALLIMVVLSLLGVSFLLISDTENKISVNERNDQQMLYVAEAGVEVVRSWFDDPNPSTNPLVPTNAEVIVNRRRGDSDWDNVVDLNGAAGDVYTGGTSRGQTRLFEKPFRGRESQTFWGFPPDDSGNGPDVVLVDNLSNNNDYIDRLNRLFNVPNTASLGRAMISQINIFRPPIARDLTMRLGVATIEVIAVKRDSRDRVLSTRTVRDVIQEYPYPGPRGAIESAGLISLNGNFTPHWGFVESEDVIDFKEGKTFAGIPRDPNFEHGDDFRKYQDFNPRVYRNPLKRDFDEDGDVEAPSDFVLAYDGDCGDANLISELVGATHNGANAGANNFTWLQDPWLVYRTAKYFEDSNNRTVDQPWDWDPGRNIVDNEIISFPSKNDLGGWAPPPCTRGDASNMMQNQPVRFPIMLYETWKKAAQTGRQNVYYYTYAGDGAGEPVFRRNGGAESKEMKKWINTEEEGNEAGLHFFDTVNRMNPQCIGQNLGCSPCSTDPTSTCRPPGILTDAHKLQKGGMGGTGGNGGGGGVRFLAKGFIFINSERIDSTGVADGVDTYVAMPGEPFLDIGIDLSGDGIICDNAGCCPPAVTNGEEATSCNEWDSINNGQWDVELDDGCTPSATDMSTICESEAGDYLAHADWDDFVLAHRYDNGVIPHTQDSTGGPTTPEAPQFLHADIDSGFDMEWPHEPYLNFRYPPRDGHRDGGTGAYANSWGLIDYEVQVDFDAEETDGHKRPLNPINLDADEFDISNTTDWTDTGYDMFGPAFKLPLNLHGVMYNEGLWDGSGNLVGYGSLLMREGFRGRGTIHMYFDESLVMGEWPPPEWGLPRVYTSSRETETNMGLQQAPNP